MKPRVKKKSSEAGWLGSGPLSPLTKLLIVVCIAILAFGIIVPMVSGAHAAPLTKKEPAIDKPKPTDMVKLTVGKDKHIKRIPIVKVEKSKVKVEKGKASGMWANAVMKNGKPTIEVTATTHDGRWLSIERAWIVEVCGTDFVKPLVDDQPTKYYWQNGELYVYIDHFSTRDITFSYDTGWVETYSVFGEDEGNITVGAYNTTNLTVDLDFSAIWYNSSSGYYEIPDRSGNGNNATIYGLTNNILTNSTAIEVNTEASHTIDIPWYHTITQANLTITYNNTGASDISVDVYINDNSVGTFTATASTSDTVGVVNIQTYLTPNTTNTFKYVSNGSVYINQTQITYDHDLSTVVDGGHVGIRLDGINDYIELPVGITPKDDISVIMWVRLDKYTDYGSFYSHRYLNLKLDTVGRLTFAREVSGAETGTTTTSALPLDTWMHIAATYDAGEGKMRIYRDATAASPSVDETGTIGGSGWEEKIGARYDKTRRACITVSGFALFSRAIPQTDLELMQHMDGIPARRDGESTMVVGGVEDTGSAYTLTINATMPDDSLDHYIPIPASATHSYDVVGNTTDSEGNSFEMTRIPSGQNATFNVSVPYSLVPPTGINTVLFSHDGELYVAGNTATLNVTNFTAVNVPKPTGVWYSNACEVTNYVNNSLPNVKLYFTTNTTTTIAQSIAIVVQPTSWVNITPIQYDPQGTTSHIFRADAPNGEKVTFTLHGLRTSSVYTVYVDGTPKYVLDVGNDGSASFSHSSWSEHTFTVVRTGDTMSLIVKRMPGLLMLGVLVLVLLSVLGVAVAAAPRTEGSELNKLILLVVVAAMIIGAIALLVFAGYGVDLIRFVTP